jgi:hypothetical protein
VKPYRPEGRPRSWTTWRLLEADPARAEAIETEPVACGVTVERLLRAGLDTRATDGGDPTGGGEMES